MKRMIAAVGMLAILWISMPFSVFAEETTVYMIADEKIDLHFSTRVGSDEGIKWEYNKWTATLKISGKGIIDDLFCARLWDEDEYGSPYLANQSVRRLIIGEGIEEIENSFNDLYGLKELRLPKTLKNISNSFAGCKSLKRLNLSVDEISGAFQECDSLKQVKVHAKNVRSSFSACRALERAEISAQKLTDSFRHCGKLKNVVISEELKTAADNFAFSSRLQSITYGKDSYTIGQLEKAFPMQNVAEPQEKPNASPSCKMIDDVVGYFEGPISNLNSCDEKEENDDIQVSFDKGSGTLIIHGNGILSNLFALEKDEYELVPDGNDSIKYVEIGDGIKGIENSFNYCSGIINIHFSKHLQYIHSSFNYCEQLEKTDFAKVTIEDSFEECNALKRLRLNGHVNNSFDNCSLLESVEIEGSVTDSFEACDILKKVKISGRRVQGSFRFCGQLEKVELNRLEYADGSFTGCKKLEKVSCGMGHYTVLELKRNFDEPPYNDDVYDDYGYEYEEPKEVSKKGYWIFFGLGVALLISIGFGIDYILNKKKNKDG